MAHDDRDARSESVQLLLPWGMPSVESRTDLLGAAALWLTGGAALLLWTVVALVLTAA